MYFLSLGTCHCFSVISLKERNFSEGEKKENQRDKAVSVNGGKRMRFNK